MERLKNKVAFISGGTNGIGLATAKDFIKEGAKVIITGRSADTIEEAVRVLGNSASGFVSNAGDMSDIMQLKEKVLTFTPRVDILFPNAGYGKFAPLEEVSEELFDELFNVLVKGTYFTVQQVLPLISEGGAIILNTSIVTAYGSQNASVYSAAKSAVQSLIKNFAAELTDRRIRVNGISPGNTNTNIFNNTGMTPEQIAGAKESIIAALPFKRFADAEEIAKAVSFLASEDASYIHAAELLADGGYTAIR